MCSVLKKSSELAQSQQLLILQEIHSDLKRKAPIQSADVRYNATINHGIETDISTMMKQKVLHLTISC